MVAERKRNIVTVTTGLLLFVVVHAATGTELSRYWPS